MERAFFAGTLGCLSTSSLLIGLAFSSMEAEGSITWGHEMLLVAIIPIAASAIVRWIMAGRS